jgi:hypothetical protein
VLLLPGAAGQSRVNKIMMACQPSLLLAFTLQHVTHKILHARIPLWFAVAVKVFAHRVLLGQWFNVVHKVLVRHTKAMQQQQHWSAITRTTSLSICYAAAPSPVPLLLQGTLLL